MILINRAKVLKSSIQSVCHGKSVLKPFLLDYVSNTTHSTIDLQRGMVYNDKKINQTLGRW
jgi:hypothetical protein